MLRPPFEVCLVFRRILKNGNPFSADLAMNLFSAASLPIRFYTCFLVAGSLMFVIAAIFSGFASMPLVDTRHHMHISGFSLRPLFVKFPKVS